MVHREYEELVVDIWFSDRPGQGCLEQTVLLTLQCAADLDCRFLYPIAILGDGQIVAWMDFNWAMRIYDPRTSAWFSAMVTGEKYVAVGTYAGRSLLCS